MLLICPYCCSIVLYIVWGGGHAPRMRDCAAWGSGAGPWGVGGSAPA